MRQQTLKRKKAAKKNAQQAERRQNAIKLLKEGKLTLRSISRITEVPLSTVSMIKQKWIKEDKEGELHIVTKPNNRGRKLVLTVDEENMLVERIKVAAIRGFAIDYNSLRAAMSRIAADGRQGWKNGLPSHDTIRAFRAKHRDITCRKWESKDHAKLRAESYGHVESFFAALASVEQLHPSILSNPNWVWNIDETGIDTVNRNKTKVFSGSDSHHGGFRRVSTSYGINKHVTTVVAVSASGLKAPPFFIVAGKKISSRWLEPVQGSFRNKVTGICERFTRFHWFPPDGVIKVTEKGSMDMEVMGAFVKNVNHYVRQFCSSETYLLSLDGHSSRKGIEWVEECMKNVCEAVVSQANTSHFLQACDQTVNKRYKASIRELRDEFCRLGHVYTRLQFGLWCVRQ